MADLNSLPEEVLFIIANRLTYKELINLAPSNKMFAGLLSNRSFWINKIISIPQYTNYRFRLTNLSLYQLINWYRKISTPGTAYICDTEWLRLTKIPDLPPNIIHIAFTNYQGLALTDTGDLYKIDFKILPEPQVQVVKINPLPREIITQTVVNINGEVYLTISGRIYVSGVLGGLIDSKTIDEELVSLPLPNSEKAVQIACGRHCVAGVTDKGNLYVYGYMVPGMGKLEGKINFPDKVVQVSAGISHLAFLTDRGEVYTMGSNDEGQLGLNYDKKYSTYEPQLVNEITDGLQLFCGFNHTICITATGVYGFGSNDFEQLGVAGLVTVNLPQKFKDLPPIFSAITSSAFTLLLTYDDKMYQIGGNRYFPQDYSGTKYITWLDKILAGSGGSSYTIVIKDER